MVPRKLNPQTLTIENAETEIKQVVLSGYWKGLPISTVSNQVNAQIAAAEKEMRNPTLRDILPSALFAYAVFLRRYLVQNYGIDGKAAYSKLAALRDIAQGKPPLDYVSTAAGVPTQRYAKNYMSSVKETLNRFADFEALDPEDVSGRNSLRNKSEMEVRYQDHLDRITELKSRGVKLVVCSTHADCSNRCFPWQGRIYSVDGTSGTVDGRSYVPIQQATDIFYTTKAGKVYKNGLLGFNCRHYLHEYVEGMSIPKVSRATQRRESAVNERQREYERRIRKYRERALTLRSALPQEASKARATAIRLNKEYMTFSRENNRAYYPDRVKILA